MSIQFILGALFGMLLTACIAIAIEVSRVDDDDGHEISLVDTIGIMGDIVKVVQITRKDRKIVTLNQKQLEEITELAKEYFKKDRVEK